MATRVTKNGRAQARKVTLGSGTVEVRAPRVHDRRTDESGKRRRFTSRVLPPYMRRRLNCSELLPLVRAGVTFADGLMQERGDHDVKDVQKEAA